MSAKCSRGIDSILFIGAVRIRQNRLYSVDCVRIACSYENITVLGSRQFFDEMVLLRILFLYNAFHVDSQKLILHQILAVYQRINFINKGLSIFKKLQL